MIYNRTYCECHFSRTDPFILEKKSTGYYYTGSTAKGASVRQVILGEMMKSPLGFVVEGGGKKECLSNIKKHVDTREQVVKNAVGAVFGFATGTYKKMNHTVSPQTPVGSQVFYTSVNNPKTLIPCQEATPIIFYSALNLVYPKKRATGTGFIPGDWAYIKNDAFDKTTWQQGYEGENLIVVGDDLFWGHLDQDWTLSWEEWKRDIARWTSKDNKQPGRPQPRDYILSPMNGLKEIKDNP